MNIIKKTIIINFIFGCCFFIALPAPARAQNTGDCLCGIQDLTKKDDIPMFKVVSQVQSAEDCNDSSVQGIYGQNINVSACTWTTTSGKTVQEKASATCSCLNKQTGTKTEKKQDVNFTYPQGTSEKQKGVFFALEGQKFCSSISTSQQSCVFIDTIYGGGNIAPADTKISAYAKDLNFLGSTDVRVVLGKAINIIMGIAGSIAFVMFIYGGFLQMTSMGDASKIQEGKLTMLYASLGIAVIFASYTIISFIFEAVT